MSQSVIMKSGNNILCGKKEYKMDKPSKRKKLYIKYIKIYKKLQAKYEKEQAKWHKKFLKELNKIEHETTK